MYITDSTYKYEILNLLWYLRCLELYIKFLISSFSSSSFNKNLQKIKLSSFDVICVIIIQLCLSLSWKFQFKFTKVNFWSSRQSTAVSTRVIFENNHPKFWKIITQRGAAGGEFQRAINLTAVATFPHPRLIFGNVSHYSKISYLRAMIHKKKKGWKKNGKWKKSRSL